MKALHHHIHTLMSKIFLQLKNLQNTCSIWTKIRLSYKPSFNELKTTKTNLFWIQTAYEEYFKWKDSHVGYKPRPYCTLCEKLHNLKEGDVKMIDLKQWFFYDPKDHTPLCEGVSKYLQDATFFNKMWHAAWPNEK